MSDHPLDSRIEHTIDAIVFAHEPGQAVMPSADDQGSSYERAASLATAALVQPAAVPEHLQQRLRGAANAFCAGFESASAPALHRRPSRAAWFGVLLGAAAASLLFVLGVFDPGAPSLHEQRRSALQGDPQAQRVSWQESGVDGDVVWRPAQQQGWLTFRGLPELQPGQSYQLWIVDSTRQEKQPIDGGVFRPTTGQTEAGDTVIPIDAKLPIGKAAAFVVTIEHDAGVVVSDQQRVFAKAIL